MQKPLKVLFVEDMEDDLELLLRELRKGGYQVEYKQVTSRAEMRTALETNTWDLILSDYALPGFNGEAALALWKQMQLDIPFIVISGHIGEDTAVSMMKAGASDYLRKNNLSRFLPAVERELREAQSRREGKQAEESFHDSEARFALFMDYIPVQVVIKDTGMRMVFANRRFRETYRKADWPGGSIEEALPADVVARLARGDPRVLQGGVVRALDRVELEDGVHHYETIKFPIPTEKGATWIGWIAWDVTERLAAEDKARKASEELQRAYDSTLEGWAKALELREQETAGHSRKAAAMTVDLARKMGVKEEEIIHIWRGGLLHDIGKIGIPDNILLKPGPLTEDEWIIMRQHPAQAYEMLKGIPYLLPALDIPYCHHEKWNGSGYPRGLKGEEIPIAARIFAIADVWEAIRSRRPYRPEPWSKEKALEFIGSQAGIHFDPAVVDVFLNS